MIHGRRTNQVGEAGERDHTDPVIAPTGDPFEGLAAPWTFRVLPSHCVLADVPGLR